MTVKITIDEILGKTAPHGEFIFKNWKGPIPREGEKVMLNQGNTTFAAKIYDVLWLMDKKEVWLNAE